jgi:hypothetical protein
VARCDTTRNHDKSRDSRVAPVRGTLNTKHLPNYVVLHNLVVQKIIVSFQCVIVDKIFVVCNFRSVSILQTVQCRKVGWQMNDELRRVWKEAVVT